MDQTNTSEGSSADLPHGIEFYDLQIAGHHYLKKSNYVGMLVNTFTGTILKPIQPAPRGDREVSFYEKIWENHGVPLIVCEQLRSLIPRYFGTVELKIDGHARSFMQLENVTFPFRKPCVIDVKVGLRTWDPEADEEKIAYELSKYPFIRRLGFRFLGMKVFNPLTQLQTAFDKKWGTKLTEDDVEETFRVFFNHDAGWPQSGSVVAGIVQKLQVIEAWFVEQKEFVFYSSSLLIAYDAAGGCERNASSPTVGVCRLDVKMIDFTHVFSSDEVDSNYLFGLRNLIGCLMNYAQRCTGTQDSDPDVT